MSRENEKAIVVGYEINGTNYPGRLEKGDGKLVKNKKLPVR